MRSAAAEPTCVLINVSMCTMLHALTVTIVNVILSQLQGALSATPEQVSWFDTVPGLARFGAELDRQAMMVGYANSFALYAALSFVTLPLLLFVRIRRRGIG